ncbi:MAG TPA: hypothetical protein VGQ93_00570, partial [Lysobacter sp.]|nr:hypothetical protein [Lysobacter sp.]
WEPHKYATPEEQNSMLGVLQAWVAEYYHRDGPWSLAEHQRMSRTALMAPPMIAVMAPPAMA